MKKIIATVLAMVMALALCTTAFAAETYTNASKFDAASGAWKTVDLAGATIAIPLPPRPRLALRLTRAPWLITP